MAPDVAAAVSSGEDKDLRARSDISHRVAFLASSNLRCADSSLPFLVFSCQVVPWMKLPAFYLLDAISKNVFDPYARHFSPFVIPLFLESYQQVDQQTRSKMEEMLITWRTGSPTGKELFGVITQLSIERGIWGGDSASPADVRVHVFSGSSPSSLHLQATNFGGVNQVSRAQVLSELEFTLGQKERILQASPWDTTAPKHIEVLQQVCDSICSI